MPLCSNCSNTYELEDGETCDRCRFSKDASKDLYKVWGEYNVLVRAESDTDAEEKVARTLSPLLDISEDSGRFTVKPPALEQISRDKNEKTGEGDFS